MLSATVVDCHTTLNRMYDNYHIVPHARVVHGRGVPISAGESCTGWTWDYMR